MEIRRETTSHQVAIAGRVSDQNQMPLHRVKVELIEMPEDLKAKRSLLQRLYKTDWETSAKRFDQTYTAIDGWFYFIDLPTGHYTIQLSSSEGSNAQNPVPVVVNREVGATWINLSY
ncbi:hypothetical protein ACQ4M3_03725 [Leptolyngbya sp. AN03gr2]|uniref:hypothetical protein n=1 Tax=unclassified Leptolyngbya TaxID=2650499 RepID=UPI003D320E66